MISTKATPSTTTEDGPPARNTPHRYPLCSRAQSNHTVETVGEGAISFQWVLDPNSGKTQGYTHLTRRPDKGTWNTTFSNDIGRLTQGVGHCIKGTNTIFFIHRSGVSAGKRVIYGQIIVPIKTNKTETHRVRITVGVDKISYKGPTATQCAILITTKIVLNSVFSTILDMLMCAYIHNFYYNTPMVYFEYMKIPLIIFPEEILNKYNLRDIMA